AIRALQTLRKTCSAAQLLCQIGTLPPTKKRLTSRGKLCEFVGCGCTDSIAVLFQPYFAAERPIHDTGVRKHERYADYRDDGHDSERLLRRGGVIDRKAVFYVWPRRHQVRVQRHAEQAHKR